jgi:tetratricopeptide (TPR) repeat protein
LANRTESDPAIKEARYKEAIDILTSVRNADPESPTVIGDLASAFSEAGGFYELQNKKEESDKSYENAVQLYERIRNKGYGTDILELNLAVLYGKLDRIGDAQKGFDKMLNSNPNDGHALLLYGLFLIDQKKYTDAYMQLEKAEQNAADPADKQLAQNKRQELKDRGLVK